MLFSGKSSAEDIKVDPYLQDKIQNMIDRQSPADYVTKQKFQDFANLYFISEEDEEEFRNFRNGNLTFIKFLIEVILVITERKKYSRSYSDDRVVRRTVFKCQIKLFYSMFDQPGARLVSPTRL